MTELTNKGKKIFQEIFDKHTALVASKAPEMVNLLIEFIELAPDMARRLSAIKKLPNNVEKAEKFMFTILSLPIKHEMEKTKNVAPINE